LFGSGKEGGNQNHEMQNQEPNHKRLPQMFQTKKV
jgi:hypothetical protein